MSAKTIKNPSESDNSFAPDFTVAYPLSKVKFTGKCLKQDSVPFLHKTVVTLYITYELDAWSINLNAYFTLGNCLFRAVKLTMNADPDKYGYSCYGTGLDACSQFLWSDGSWGKNVAIFDA